MGGENTSGISHVLLIEPVAGLVGDGLEGNEPIGDGPTAGHGGLAREGIAGEDDVPADGADRQFRVAARLPGPHHLDQLTDLGLDRRQASFRSGPAALARL
jgi:hypothetical protein